MKPKKSTNKQRKVVFMLLFATFASLPLHSFMLSSQTILPNGMAQGVNQRKSRIDGTVIDSKTRSPIIGAAIRLKGSQGGAVTDLEGKFSIQANQGDVLTISYIGYIMKDVKASPNMIVEISEATETLNDVVVIGYGTLKKSDLTGSIAQIDPSKKEADFSPNMTDLLRNSVAGLNIPLSVNANGSVNTSDMRIRGTNSIKASNGPLIVVDGIIFDGSLEDISSQDVERIDVMKDASSAAVYGSRAANGVIQITTKKGNKGAPQVSLTTNFGYMKAANLRKPLDGPGYVNMRYQLMNQLHGQPQKDYYDNPLSLDDAARRTWYGYQLSESQRNDPSFMASVDISDDAITRAWLSRLNFYPVEIENYMTGHTVDWEGLLYQSGFKQDYNASVSGGTDKTRYYASLGYANVNGFRVGDKFETVRSKVNLENNVNKHITLGLNALFAYRNTGSIPYNSSAYQSMSPYSSVYDENGHLNLYPSGNNGQDGGYNPLVERDYTDSMNKTLDLNTKVYGILHLPYGFQYTFNYVNNFSFNLHNRHTSVDSPDTGAGNSAYRNNASQKQWTIENILSWRHSYGKHNIDVTLMQNAESVKYWSDRMNGSAFDPSDVLGYHAMSLATVTSVTSNDWKENRDALLARANYNWNERYYLTAAVRRDGFSAFGNGNAHENFPTVATSWRISSEPWFHVKWVDDLKLRYSWGANGQSAIGRYDALALMNIIKLLYANPDGSYYTKTGLSVARLANNDLKWEKTTQHNIGIDFSVLGNCITGSFEYYSAKTTNLLLDRQLPSITSVKSVAANLGEVTNNGFEFTLNTLNIDLDDKFQWRTTTSVSSYRNRIRHLYGDYDENGREIDDTENGWYIGHSIDAIYDYKPNGIWQQEDLDAARAEHGPNSYPGYYPGNYKMVDQNNDGQYTANDDRVFLGHRNPHFFFNMTNNFTIFRNFFASFTMYGQYGGKRNYIEHFGSLNNSCLNLSYWTADNKSTKYPRLADRSIDLVMERNYKSIDFLRLSNITVGWNVPVKWVKPLGFTSLKIYGSIDNVHCWTSWPGWDPEYTSGAVPRKFNFGLNVRF